MEFANVAEAVEAICKSPWDGIKVRVKLARQRGEPITLQPGEIDLRYDPSTAIVVEAPEEINAAERCIALHAPLDALPYLGLDDWRVKVFVARGMAQMVGSQKTLIKVFQSQLQSETDELVKRNLEWAIQRKENELETLWVMHSVTAGAGLLLIIGLLMTIGGEAWWGLVAMTLAWGGFGWYQWKTGPIEFKAAEWTKGFAIGSTTSDRAAGK